MQDRIQEEYTRSSAESGGDSSAVDEFACMEHALGHRRGHIRGVGRVVIQDQQERETQQEEERHVHNQQMLEMQQQMDEMRRMWERRTSSDDN
ncbi:hypothetical protein L1987_18172 [Smallanthus sonchifolius]|uniref:Uncharacterized protein n=1 Tax=Smallanthus sonchifolius TaxID=185202 RepID=A0ACB9J2G1_9ASTR|nr:hypothetical protein L1987_18172 [Smallanthus sonchifolius]